MLQVEQSGAVTWRSWSDGQHGPIAKQWNVTSWPTLYLIDPQGNIRSKGYLRGPVLEFTVDNILKELKMGLAHDLIAPCSVWSYWDGEEPPGADWRQANFDDSQWKSGRSILGYGKGDETTALEFGPNEEAKYPTAYFRRKFQWKPEGEVASVKLGLICADGAAVFINGKEVVRDNLAADAKPKDWAKKAAPDDGLGRQYFDIDVKLLRPGENIMAAEVHRHAPDEGDLRFELTLSSQKLSLPDVSKWPSHKLSLLDPATMPRLLFHMGQYTPAPDFDPANGLYIASEHTLSAVWLEEEAVAQQFRFNVEFKLPARR